MTGYVGFGNDKLAKLPKVDEATMIECLQCGGEHPIEFGIDAETGQKTNLVGFYKCKGTSYLASVGGKLVAGVKACCAGNM